MQSLIKRNNFSPEDRKILNKIDRHIKELEDKVEQGGGSEGGGVEVYDLNIELPEGMADIFLNQQPLNYDGVIRPEIATPSFIDCEIKPGCIVNVYLNSVFYFNTLVTETSFMGYNACALVPNIMELSVMMSDSQATNEIPYLCIVSLGGMSILGPLNQFYKSDITIEGETVITQDTKLLKVMYNDIGESQVIKARRQYTDEYNHVIYDTIYLKLRNGTDANGLFIARSTDETLEVRFDSDGIIQYVKILNFLPWQIYDAIKELDERLKALENGN